MFYFIAFGWPSRLLLGMAILVTVFIVIVAITPLAMGTYQYLDPIPTIVTGLFAIIMLRSLL